MFSPASWPECLRSRNRDALNAAIGELTRRKSSAEWIEELNARGIPSGPINRIDEAMRDPQVMHLGIATPVDHPTLGRQKRLGEGDFSKIPNGLPGVEHRLELVYHGAVAEDRLSLERWVEVTSTTPARMFGLYPRKGAIRVGADADLTLVDLSRRAVIRGTEMQAKVKFTVYEGWEAHGLPVYTFVRGTCVMRDGEVIGRPGHGQLVRPLG